MDDLTTSGRRDRRRRRRKVGIKRVRTILVIAWEGVGWGIDIDNGNGRHKAYAVGSREAAEQELQRLRSGGRAPTRKQVAQLMKDRAVSYACPSPKGQGSLCMPAKRHTAGLHIPSGSFRIGCDPD